MKITDFNKGIISSSLGSFWWGFLGTYYFQYITFIGTIEVVVHRCIWTTLILLITTIFFKLNKDLKLNLNETDLTKLRLLDKFLFFKLVSLIDLGSIKSLVSLIIK